MTARTPTDLPFPPVLPDDGRGPAPGGPASRGVIRLPAGVELGIVMRALAAIFWGLPVTLLAFARHFLAFMPSAYDLLLPPAGTGLLLYGVLRLSRFHRQERVWQQSVFTSQTLAALLFGLAPFLFLWSRLPGEPLFARAVALLMTSSLVFLVALTNTLSRLAAMLPDPSTQADAALFHRLTGGITLTVVSVTSVLYWRLAPPTLSEFLALPQQPVPPPGVQAFMLVLVLIPVAMTMAVTWKLKEVVVAVLVGRRPG